MTMGTALVAFWAALAAGGVHSHDDVDSEAQQVADQRREAVTPAVGIPDLGDDALALDIAQMLELIAKRLQQAGLHVLGEHAQAWHHTPLLRHRGERGSEDGGADQEGSPANHSMGSAS